LPARGIVLRHLRPFDVRTPNHTSVNTCLKYFHPESESASGFADFSKTPSESVRLQDFEIRNNTTE